jgi:hypothetical protein
MHKTVQEHHLAKLLALGFGLKGVWSNNKTENEA